MITAYRARLLAQKTHTRLVPPRHTSFLVCSTVRNACFHFTVVMKTRHPVCSTVLSKVSIIFAFSPERRFAPRRDTLFVLISFRYVCQLTKNRSSSGNIITIEHHQRLFGVLDPRCLTGSALLDRHALKGFGTYMIGIVDSLSGVWKPITGTRHVTSTCNLSSTI